MDMGNFDSMFGDRRNISDVTRDKYDVSKEDTQKNAQEIAILQSKREAMQSDKKRLETQKSYLVSQQKEAQAARDNAKARFDQAAASVQKELGSSNPDIRRNAENRVAADKQYLEETEATLKRITREIEKVTVLLAPIVDLDKQLALLKTKYDTSRGQYLANNEQANQELAQYQIQKEQTEINILSMSLSVKEAELKGAREKMNPLLAQQKEAQAARDNAKARFDQAAASVQKELGSSNPDIRRNAENRVAADKQYLEETEATLKRITREIERKQQLLGPLIQQVASLHTQKQDHDQRLASLMPKKDVIIRVASQPLAKPEKVLGGAEKRLHDKTIKIAKNVDPVLVAKALSTYAQKKNIPGNQSITAEQIRSDLNLGNYKNLIIGPNTLAALDNFNSQNA
ncbi:MAG: hypothetical protein U0518_03650 [Candidatus Gracilibacteria bacterium]